MKKIVSLFGERSDVFDKLNEEARLYAESLGHEYVWAPQVPYQRSEAVDALKHADVGIIDIEPYDQEVFKDIADRTKLLVRFGVGYDKVDLKAASEFGIAVSRTTGANTLGVAEMAVSLILSARRMLRINQKCVESGKWTKNVAREMINRNSRHRRLRCHRSGGCPTLQGIQLPGCRLRSFSEPGDYEGLGCRTG